MASQAACPGCGVRVRLREEEVQRLLEEYLQRHPGRVVGVQDYDRRLALCRACDALDYGTTCRYCGCLAPVRAKLADARCPHPAQPRW